MIKPPGSYLHGCSSLAGTTTIGDGQVQLVLDPAGFPANLQASPFGVRKATA